MGEENDDQSERDRSMIRRVWSKLTEQGGGGGRKGSEGEEEGKVRITLKEEGRSEPKENEGRAVALV